MDPRSASTGQAVSLQGLRYAWPGPSTFSIEVDSFAISSGEAVLLLGESGAGKSTLLSLICGIFPPNSGQIVVNGVDLASLGQSQRDRFRAEHIGVIFQMFNLLPYASALDNVVLPVHFSPARRARLQGSVHQSAVDMLKALGIPETVIEHGTAGQLSVGQQQRVAVARALIGAPSLIVADEPTSSLDRDSQARFLGLLFENVRKAGSTLLMVSHDERLASRFDRAVRLSEIARVSREHAA